MDFEKPFKHHKIVLFCISEKNMCAYPTLNFQACYPKHTYFYNWPKKDIQIDIDPSIEKT